MSTVVSTVLRIVALSGLIAWGAAFAQSSLLIDGRPAGEVRTDLVPGNSYAPADLLAEELGARLAAPVGSDTVALLFGGHVLQLDVVPFGDDAGITGAVRLNGSPVGDLAAIRGDDAVWVPVAPVVRAFGASISYLAERDAVVVVTPRPSVNDATLERRDGFDLLRIPLDGPVAWQRFDDAAVGVTEITLRRARLTQAESLSGTWIRRADLIPAGQGVRIRIDAPGASLAVTTLAAGRGSEVRIRVEPASDTPGEPPDEADLSVVLDPGHGAGSGLPGEGEGSLALARAVAERLEREGVSVRLTRQAAGDVPHTQRLSAAADADLFLSLHAADLPSGEVRVWVLGEAAEETVMRAAIRRNAREALDAGVEDELRRRILLGLVPDLELGRRYGRAIATALFQVGGYRAGEVEAAPLALLEGAAGRGVLLEFALDDLGDPDLPEVLAAAVRSAASGAQ